jgi:bifunctional DNase/RNase
MAICQHKGCLNERHFHVAMFRNRAISRIEHFCIDHGLDMLRAHVQVSRDEVGTGIRAECDGAVCFGVECVIYIEGGAKSWFMLREVGGKGTVKLPCGYCSAASFVSRLMVTTPHPGQSAHDALIATAGSLGGAIIRTIIDGVDFATSTYHASVVIDQSGKQIRIETQPTDAIILANLSQAPFFFSRNVLSLLTEYYGYTTCPWGKQAAGTDLSGQAGA